MSESKTESGIEPRTPGALRRIRVSSLAGPRWCYAAALLSGVLLGLSFPPYDFWPLALVALVPLLASIHELKRLRPAFVAGGLAGTIFFLFNLHPLLSAHLWSGWATGDSAEFAMRASRQSIVLTALWVLLALWAGVFYGIFAAITTYACRGNLVRMGIIAPAAFVLIPEWLRSVTAWDYAWAFLGNLLADLDGLRQIASIGGVWLLTFVVVVANVAVLGLLSGRRRPLQALVSAMVIASLLALNVVLAPATDDTLQKKPRAGLRVAALQYNQERYGLNDYMALGLERAYLQLIRQIALGRLGEVDLLVLPESIAYTVASLDGTRVPRVPEQAHNDLERWTGLMNNVMAWSEGRMAIAGGLETAESGQLHNSMIFWQPGQNPHWYHKQRLVPFAEYQPGLLRFLGLSASRFQAGNESAIITVHGVQVGAFICQEVLMPDVARKSTLAGAQLLISGGNDGVFEDPAVAQIHAMHARIRAVETGRFLVRAMKTGVSAIISPTGSIVDRSRSSEPEAIAGQVHARDTLTPFARWGNWPVLLAAIVVMLGLGTASAFRSRRPGHGSRFGSI